GPKRTGRDSVQAEVVLELVDGLLHVRPLVVEVRDILGPPVEIGDAGRGVVPGGIPEVALRVLGVPAPGEHHSPRSAPALPDEAKLGDLHDRRVVGREAPPAARGRVAPDLAGQIGRHPELDHVVPAPASHRAYSASTSNPRSARRITVRCRACGSRATFWVRNATASVAVPVSPGRRRLLMTTPLFRSRQRKGWYEARPRAGRARGRHRDGA